MANIADEFRCIGKGFCGSVWASSQADEPAMKREDGGPGRSLRNDWDMHNIVRNAFTSLKNNFDNMIVPQPHVFITGEDMDWWNKNVSRFPVGFSPCNTLVSTRVPPLPKPVRERLVDRYCPPQLAPLIKTNRGDEDCVVRPYLGRRRIGQRVSRFQSFTLRNFPLHVDQMEDLGLNIFIYAAKLADALAIMHWVAGVDANDVEFVLASCPHQISSPLTSDFLGEHTLWILDFDCCPGMPMDLAGVEQAVAAFFRNDPFFPRPAATDARDQGLWRHFRAQYIRTSDEMLRDSSLKKLPELFIEHLEERGRELAMHKEKLSTD
ncbi:hypothetical protein NA57DRAFT_49382 [Rhizodiscina lignyota]|uniref:DUF3669 domain-containing protein n=1 Tax=Rhizodiscina lignyota TaxID=1504668 RepID=A0A9P4LZS3_9PEZI|nr:hypothetical protein NA57DRAFT_49382 [Rhizodiscina lignyota]